MRPVASTAVASMQKIAAPDKASELIWVKCQSVAEPSTAEYWHIGATMMRLGNFSSRNRIGENRTLIRGFPAGEKQTVGSCVTRRPSLLNPLPVQPSPLPAIIGDIAVFIALS